MKFKVGEEFVIHGHMAYDHVPVEIKAPWYIKWFCWAIGHPSKPDDNKRIDIYYSDIRHKQCQRCGMWSYYDRSPQERNRAIIEIYDSFYGSSK